jgi:transcriptional regulator GlxA family with amidase domain
MLSICDGSITAAATGIYDGKQITTHASDFEKVKKQFSKPIWVTNVSITQNENLYSTAGVSNAVEGSLAVISDLFDRETMLKIKESINYPNPTLKIEHQSVAINSEHKMTIANKVFFKGIKKIGVLLQNETNEFELAAVLDTLQPNFS